MSKRKGSHVNPYIATTDVMIGLVLVFVIMLVATTVVGASREAELRGVSLSGRVQSHELAAQEVRERLQALPDHLRPIEDGQRHDPIGTQRWRFASTQLFEPGTTLLTTDGQAMICAFGEALAQVGTWRRVRVEGHTRRTAVGERDDWERSTDLAVSVVNELVGSVGIQPWFIAVAGRGGQAPVSDGSGAGGEDERVDVIVEYCVGAACSRDVVWEAGLGSCAGSALP